MDVRWTGNSVSHSAVNKVHAPSNKRSISGHNYSDGEPIDTDVPTPQFQAHYRSCGLSTHHSFFRRNTVVVWQSHATTVLRRNTVVITRCARNNYFAR